MHVSKVSTKKLARLKRERDTAEDRLRAANASYRRLEEARSRCAAELAQRRQLFIDNLEDSIFEVPFNPEFHSQPSYISLSRNETSGTIQSLPPLSRATLPTSLRTLIDNGGISLVTQVGWASNVGSSAQG